MKTIKLTRGYSAIVDDEDYQRFGHLRWGAQVARLNPLLVYATRKVKHSILCCLHREIMGAKPGVMVDHRDGDGLNNRRRNLRFCTNSQNLQNQRLNARNTSGFKGVSKGNRKWRAQIRFSGKTIFLGAFKYRIDAARCYDKWARRYFGEFAMTNRKLGLLC